MMKFIQGNLLEAPRRRCEYRKHGRRDGKGGRPDVQRSLPANFRAYEDACKHKDVTIGHMFVTERLRWRGRAGSSTFRRRSIGGTQPSSSGSSKAPRLAPSRTGSGHPLYSIASAGSRQWGARMEGGTSRNRTCSQRPNDVEVLVYEPTEKYQNVAKHTGVEKLTPARATHSRDNSTVLGSRHSLHLPRGSETGMVSGKRSLLTRNRRSAKTWIPGGQIWTVFRPPSSPSQRPRWNVPALQQEAGRCIPHRHDLVR